MIEDKDLFILEDEYLSMEACRVEWDSDILGAPVANITKFVLNDSKSSKNILKTFEMWLQKHNYIMVSCRLPHNKLLETALLESNGFRFIEMVMHPTLPQIPSVSITNHDLIVDSVDVSDVSQIADIAESAFSYERFHIDPFLDSRLGDLRYRKWVENSIRDDKQQLLKVTLNGEIVGFFVVEYKSELVYWHLTAIASAWQGKGLGTNVWKAMIEYHKNEGFKQVLTTISARNVPVLNLYAKLNFRFLAPEMTFHWVKSTSEP